jgi:uncharacterized metal-binding protein YceD (DUF177 family)
MPLSVNLRHLEAHDIELKGELPVEDLALDTRDEMVRAGNPLKYELEIQKLDQALLLQGSLQLTLDCQCVRCLKPFTSELRLDNWKCHVPLEGEEKAEVSGDFVDLTPYLREDILLEFPQHPLCEADCRGLLKTEPAKNSDPEQTRRESSAWAELDKLKFK